MSFYTIIKACLAACQRFLSRHLTTICWLFLTLLLLLTLALTTLLPHAVEKAVTGLANELSIEGALDFSVLRISLFRSDLSCYSSGDAHQDPNSVKHYLSIPSVGIRYRPLQLLRGHIDSIELDGVQAALQLQDGKLKLPLLKLLRPKENDQHNKQTKAFSLPDFYEKLPLQVERITLNGHVLIATPDELIPVTCHLQLLTAVPDSAEPLIDFQAFLRHSRNLLHCTGKLNITKALLDSKLQWQIDSEAMPLGLRQLLPEQCQVALNGQSELLFDLENTELQLKEARASGSISQAQQRAAINSQATLAANLRDRTLSALNAELDAMLDLKAPSLKLQCQAQLTASLQDNQRLSLMLSGLNGEFHDSRLAIDRLEAHIDSAVSSAAGNLFALIDEQALPELLFTASRQEDEIKIAISTAETEDLESAQAAPQRWRFGGYELSLATPVLSATAQLKDGVHGQLSLNCQEIQLMDGKTQAKASASALAITAAAQIKDGIYYHLTMSSDDLAGHFDQLRTAMSSAALDLKGSGRDFTAQLELNALSGQGPAAVQATLDSALLELSSTGSEYQGLLRINDGRLKQTPREFNANFALEWPLQWPPPESAATPGFFQLSECRLGQEVLGAMNGSISLSQQGLSVTGDAKLRGLAAALSLDLRPFPAADYALTAAFTLPKQPFSQELLPTALLPKLSEFSLGGNITAEATFQQRGGKQRGQAAIQITDAELSNPAKNFELSGLKLSFSLPELPTLRSAGNQQLSFQRLSLGNVLVSNGRLRFTMEQPASWLVESLSCKWCDGRVRLDATRFTPEARRTRLTLNCDRIKLGALLEQLGVGQDHGEGRISGTIPVLLTDHGPRFRDAFLYSTPGEDGLIRLRPAGTLNAMAAASDQLSLALDALSDYSYTWVKLSLDSDKDMLKLKLETDGKPTQPLFYAPKDGNIVRSDVASIFQGLQLNANFNLPLEKSTELFQSVNELFKKQ
jgi:hypothetical protein